MNVVATRQRTRGMALEGSTDKPAPQPSKNLRDLAARFYGENRTANDAANAAKKTREFLYKGMQSEGIKEFQIAARKEDGENLQLVAAIDTPVGTAMDVTQLWSLLGAAEGGDNLKRFLSMVTVTKTKVDEELGKNVSARIGVPAYGTENVSVKPAK